MDCAPALRKLDEAAQRLQALPKDASDELRRALYLQARWIVRGLVFANPALDFDRLLFVKRFTQETYPDVCLNHMPWCSRPGGDSVHPAQLARRAGELRRSALAARDGETPRRDACATSAAAATSAPSSTAPSVPGICTAWTCGGMAAASCSAMRARRPMSRPKAGSTARGAITSAGRSSPPISSRSALMGGTCASSPPANGATWTRPTPPGGDIVFVSERCGTSLQCNEYDKDETSCNLYVMKPDGTGIRRLSANKDGDYLPHTLDDGTVGYLRWEYHERSWAFIQSIWTIRPDGTGADALFKQHFVNPWSLEDARSIPGSKKLVCIAAGHHTLAAGPLVVVDPSLGINEPKGMSIVTPDVKPPEGGMDGVPAPRRRHARRRRALLDALGAFGEVLPGRLHLLKPTNRRQGLRALRGGCVRQQGTHPSRPGHFLLHPDAAAAPAPPAGLS